jgi:glutamyl-tRNA synthetase
MPDRAFTVHDLVRGDVEFAAGTTRDYVLVRSDGSPTYMLAAPVDDHLMEMTHVIRGEDLLPSTPGQLALIEALGGTPPDYAHLPMIVGSDRAPLSKRHGSVSIEAFREQGFLPEALMNYLALLGWSKDEHTTFLSRDELIEAFDVTRVSHNPAAFDTEKLEWMNGHYIQHLDVDDLAARLLPFFGEAGVAVDIDLLKAAVPLINERMKLLPEAVDLLRFLFTDDITPSDKASALLGKAPEGYVAAGADVLDALADWTHEAIAAALDALAQEAGLNRTKGWQPIRAAVTGSNISPPLPESLELLGRERTVARLRAVA